ncbi:multidrug effflux MFS transporter [Leucobacter sp. GX0328]
MRAPSHVGSSGRISPGLMIALGYVSMAASLSTDLYLPSFPGIAEHFAVGPSIVQLTLTAFMLGAALGQLVIGALSDALGRRPTLIVGLAVFAACACAAAMSPSIELLIAARFVQGFAGSAGAVLARAVIADLLPPAETARAYGTLFVMIALGPAVANPLGGWLTELGGWRTPLAGLAVLTAGMFAVAVLAVPESLPHGHRQRFHAGRLLGNLKRLACTPLFAGFAGAFGLAYAGMMAYISASSFIVQDVFGLSPLGYSLTFALTSATFMCGAWVSRRLVPRFGGVATLRAGQTVQLSAAGLGIVLVLTGVFPFGTYLVVVASFTCGTGMIMPTSSALAVAQAVGVVGAGSALVGFSQFLFAAIGTPLGGLFGTGTALPTLIAMAGFALLSFVLAGVSIRRAR